jgi:hypothetical protein
MGDELFHKFKGEAVVPLEVQQFVLDRIGSIALLLARQGRARAVRFRGRTRCPRSSPT